MNPNPNPDPRPYLVAGGIEEVSADRLDNLDGRFEESLAYAIKSGTHLWHAILTYRVSVEALATVEAEPLIFDAENLLMRPMLGCYVCEEPYSPEKRLRACRPSRGSLARIGNPR